MKKILFVLASFSFFSFLVFQFLNKKANTEFPKPTTIIINGEEDGDNQIKREEWFDQMHRAAPGTNWRALEYRTQKERHEKRLAAGHFGAQNRDGGETEVLANGHLIGRWVERGSLNQAGSVFEADYDPETDEIWLLSAGGTLWKGLRDGSNWEPVNQDFKFSNGLLKFIPHNGGRRLLSAIERVPHYSDDDGITWTAAEGIPIDDGWGNVRHTVVLNDSLNTIYTISKRSYWEPTKIFKSTDKGENFFQIHDFGRHEFDYSAMVNPHNSLDVYVIEKGPTVRFSKINPQTNGLELLSENQDSIFKETRANLVGWTGNATTWFYAYDSDKVLLMSQDFGNSWEARDTIGERPWSVGLYVSPSDPNVIFSGAVNCYKTLNGGFNWHKINDWWEYYNDVEHKLHADIMDFNEFRTADGEKFLLVSNHGGLNISYDDLNTLDNIGLEGLNVSQYYSVRTNQDLPYWVYAGSQDQGLQRSNIFNQDVADFEQVISGDYGHIVMTDDGEDLWTCYPGGWITYYNFAQQGGYAADYTMDSDHESVWLPPLMEAPYGENAVFMAGGNINGGGGSYLVKLQLGNQNQIIASQGDFDFRSHSGNDGQLSAIEFSTLNPELFYGATTNGRFFYSEDGGGTWDNALGGIPGGHYLYGQSIYASKKDTNTVWLGGSGYSNPAVYKSDNGGGFFFQMSEGLPPTLVFEITGNDDESLLFAATEAGPFVYVFEEEQWYDMSGLCAPAQTYWSVEYIREFNVVRFGTYGRGIWDFEIDEVINTKEEFAKQPDFKIYPNPSDGVVNFEFKNAQNVDSEVRIFDVSGQLIRTFNYEKTTPNQLNMSDLPTGTYFINLKIDGKSVSKKLYIQ